MAFPREDDQVEVLVGGDQGVDDLHGADRVDVPVETADGEEQVAGELVGVDGVRVGGPVVPEWRWADGVTHPQFVPPQLVDAVVVAAAIRGRGRVEVAVVQHRTQGVLAAGGAAVDAHAGDVQRGEFFRRGPQPGDAVRQAGVLQVLPADVVEGFAPPVRARPVDAGDDEAEGRQFPRPGLPAVGLRHVLAVRAGVDVLDDGVFLRPVGRVAAGREQQQPVDVGHPVAALRREPHRAGPAGGAAVGVVGPLQFEHAFPRFPVPQHGHGRQVDAGEAVDQEPPVRRPLPLVRAVARLGVVRREHGKVGAVQIHPAQVLVIRVLPRDQAGRDDEDPPGFLIHPLDPPHDPLAGGDLIDHLPGRRVVAVQVIPPVPLAGPQQLRAVRRPGCSEHPGRFAVGPDRGSVQPVQFELRVVVDERVGGFLDDGADLAGLAVDRQHPQRLVAAFVVQAEQFRRVRRPPPAAERVGVRHQVVRHVGPFAGGNLEQHRPRRRQRVAGLAVGVGDESRAGGVGGAGVDEGDACGLCRRLSDDQARPTVRRTEQRPAVVTTAGGELHLAFGAVIEERPTVKLKAAAGRRFDGLHRVAAAGSATALGPQYDLPRLARRFPRFNERAVRIAPTTHTSPDATVSCQCTAPRDSAVYGTSSPSVFNQCKSARPSVRLMKRRYVGLPPRRTGFGSSIGLAPYDGHSSQSTPASRREAVSERNTNAGPGVSTRTVPSACTPAMENPAAGSAVERLPRPRTDRAAAVARA